MRSVHEPHCVLVRNVPSGPVMEVVIGFANANEASDFVDKHRGGRTGPFMSSAPVVGAAEYGLPPVAERVEILEKAAGLLDAAGWSAASRELRDVASKIYGNKVSLPIVEREPDPEIGTWIAQREFKAIPSTQPFPAKILMIALGSTRSPRVYVPE